MKETGIIMSGSHPKLILEGLKTQTRRVIKNKYGLCTECWNKGIPHNADKSIFVDAENRPIIYLKVPYCEHNDIAGGRISFPYGQVGDRFWVRETYCAGCAMETPRFACYKASTNPELWPPCVESIVKPSIFMPRWASRILLEITEVRAERLQEITEEDAIAEGYKPSITIPGGETTARYAYMVLWDSLNAKRGYGWEINPWVWVISFNLVGARLK